MKIQQKAQGKPQANHCNYRKETRKPKGNPKGNHIKILQKQKGIRREVMLIIEKKPENEKGNQRETKGKPHEDPSKRRKGNQRETTDYFGSPDSPTLEIIIL